MNKMTVKTSTIFIAKGDKTRVYHSMNEVPPKLRKELDESTNSFNSATILIADRRGREEIVRALNGLPSSLRSRLAQSLNPNQHQPSATPPVVLPEPVELKPFSAAVGFLRRFWLEITIPSAVGCILWAAFHFR
jgi:hypothetical protein